MENYEPISFIGKGNFGSITKIRRKIDGKILVWKEFNYGLLGEKERNRIVQEINILRELHHPNIVKYYDRIIDHKNTKLYIVMEYCPGGDLSQLIKRNRKINQYFSEDIIWKIFAQVSSALYACHTYKGGIILHRDIKPSNIFIDQDNNIKLGDFGLSRILNQDISFAVSRVGTPYYMSPEQIDNIKYNEKSDIWSLGCFLYELTTLHPPFEAKTHLNLARKIKSGKMDLIPNFYSQKLNELINSLMNINPNQRPNIKEIIGISEINLRIKEKRIKENYKKLKKMENMIKMREINNQKKEEALMIKEKYLNEREKNLNQREEYIKNKEEEFFKFEKNKYNLKDLSITTSNFNLRCLKITNDNSFMMSNSFTYKNIPVPKKPKNNQKDFMNKTDNLFFQNKNNNNSYIKQKEYYSAYNTNPNMKTDSTQNIDYNNYNNNNNKNDSTQNVSYNVNNRNESAQNIGNNINNNVLEVNSNHILYNPSSEKKNLNKYLGTSPNNKSNCNNGKNQKRNCNDYKKINVNHQNNFSYDIEFRKNQNKIINQKEINNDKIFNNINKKVCDKEYNDYIDKKYRKNFFNKIIKKNEKCINDEKTQNYNNKHKENIYNNHIINFNNANNNAYLINNKNQDNSKNDMINENLSERFYMKNYYNNININKNFSSKLISPAKAFSKENINYYRPESDYLYGYNKNLRLGGNLYFGIENEKFNKEEKKISQKHNSFNEPNVKRNSYGKNQNYNSKKSNNTSYKKGLSNLNTINL